MNRRKLLTAIGLAPVALVVGSAQAALPPQGRLSAHLNVNGDWRAARRARLTALIDDPRYDFVWVKMPLGAGKTTLLWQLVEAQQSEGHPVAVLGPTWDYFVGVRHIEASRIGSFGNRLAATSPARLRAKPYRTIFVDDAEQCGTCSEGNVLALAQKSTQTYAAGKVIAFSTEDMPEWMAKRRHLALDCT